MVNVGSLPAEGNRLFDLDTQAGITAVLLALRGSEITSAQKNELRDLVFSYTNGGKDQSVRLSLEQKIAAYGLVPAAPAQPKASEVFAHRQEQLTIGSFRSAPSFAVPAVPVVSAPVQATPAPVQVEVPVAPAAAPVTSAPVPEPMPTPVQVTPAPAEPIQPEVVVPTVQMPKADQQQYLERIREIKSLVNEKVGNPVNLVDINNEVGREYMSALLDAMKRINSGMSADGAMQRLETAYVAVEETLRSVAVEKPVQPAAAPTPFVPPTPEPIAEVAREPEPMPYFPPVQPAYVPPPVQVAPPPVYEPVVPTEPHYQSLAESVAPPAQHYEPIAAPQPVVPTPNYTQPAAPTIHSATPHTFSSLADMVQQSHAQTGLPTTPAAAQPLASGDVLLSAEVEDGLTQLLSEWSIFKKSGIFGSGPKGREHPLYKKMADLQIPLLLAGRFEGATQEVRQSLTDYMNGWRYEQGLIYEKGETFEHYLRRVIRHILDQNTR
jgi:hypothetical protein